MRYSYPANDLGLDVELNITTDLERVVVATAHFETSDQEASSIGVAVKEPEDDFDIATGVELAVGRALRDLGKQLIDSGNMRMRRAEANAARRCVVQSEIHLKAQTRRVQDRAFYGSLKPLFRAQSNATGTALVNLVEQTSDMISDYKRGAFTSPVSKLEINEILSSLKETNGN